MSRLWSPGKPITVETTEQGKPVHLSMDDEIHTVDSVCYRWRDGGAWWNSESEREYIKLVTVSVLLCLIAKDVGGDGDGWVMVRVYD